MSTNQDDKCRRHILHLMGDIKNCARQIKIMDLIARFKAEYSDEDIPFDSFWGWLQASNTQIGMLISQIYKLANLKDAQKNLINILGKQFNKRG
ncbi:hypothetical protein [uncultured Legionella sp.]|uniref:hypothetical protein n=1 Tax=uncultured Legionella sp. TaxID=210934 RepID=UPI0026158793|nr:hypothetical protein [uncultured Legionella sp.]